MAKYRKKPVVIEAIRWDGSNGGYAAIEKLARRGKCTVSFHHGTLHIQTREGEMHSEIGDYIIRGVEGELYPCKPSIFAATYEPA